jgi:hypothetical protein
MPRFQFTIFASSLCKVTKRLNVNNESAMRAIMPQVIDAATSPLRFALRPRRR